MSLVMIVDDDKFTRQTVRQILAAKDYQIIEAANGQECLGQVDGVRPDVVIVDAHMPGLSGVEVVMGLRTRYPDIKVIGMSSHDDMGEPQLEAMRQMGAHKIVTKPLQAANLVEAVQDVLGG